MFYHCVVLCIWIDELKTASCLPSVMVLFVFGFNLGLNRLTLRDLYIQSKLPPDAATSKVID